MGISGVLEHWSVRERLGEISMPTLCIGAEFDSMDPKHMEWMSSQVQKGRYLYCANAGHLSHYDNPEVYMAGFIQFLKDVDSGKF